MPLACCAPKAGCSSLRLAKIHQRWSFHPSACLFLRSRLWLAAGLFLRSHLWPTAGPGQGAHPSGSPKSFSPVTPLACCEPMAGCSSLRLAKVLFSGHSSGLLRTHGKVLFPPALQNPSAWAFSAFCVPFSFPLFFACPGPGMSAALFFQNKQTARLSPFGEKDGRLVICRSKIRQAALKNLSQ